MDTVKLVSQSEQRVTSLSADVDTDIWRSDFMRVFTENERLKEALEGVRLFIMGTPEYIKEWGFFVPMSKLLIHKNAEYEWRLYSFLFLLAKMDDIWNYWEKQIPTTHRETFITNLRRLCNYTLVEKTGTYISPRNFCIIMYQTFAWNSFCSEPRPGVDALPPILRDNK